MADWQWHSNQHEHEWSALEQGHPSSWGCGGLQGSSPPECRSPVMTAILQPCLMTSVDVCCYCLRRPRAFDTCIAIFTKCSPTVWGGICRHCEDCAHPTHGCHTSDTRPGVQRLCATDGILYTQTAGSLGSPFGTGSWWYSRGLLLLCVGLPVFLNATSTESQARVPSGGRNNKATSGKLGRFAGNEVENTSLNRMRGASKARSTLKSSTHCWFSGWFKISKRFACGAGASGAVFNFNLDKPVRFLYSLAWGEPLIIQQIY